MPDNLKELSKIPRIIEAKMVNLNNYIDKIRKIIGIELTKEAVRNEKKIYVYKIVYNVKGKKIVGYIVEPRKGNNLPCIIWNRGGSRDFGDIRIGQLFGNHSLIAPLALEGYIVIATQYPGVAGGEGIDKWGDELGMASILDLYKILKNYKRADYKRVGMFGHSRGGCMTYMSLSKVKWIKAAVVGAAPTNEVRSSKWRKGWAEHQKKIYGGSISEKKKRSAIFWANKISKKSPILIMHGTADWRVNPLDSVEMSIELYKNKVPHRLIMYEGADHGISEFYDDYKKQTIEWFNRFLKNKEKLPNLKLHGK